MEIENTVNDVQETVVESQTDETAFNEEADDAAEGVVDLQEEESPANADKPRQSAEENAKFAQMRRESESHKAKYDSLNASVNNIISGLKDYGFSGNTLEDIELEIKASQMGVSVDELKSSEQLKKEEIKKAVDNDPRIIEAERIARESRYNQDLEAVKKAYPDVTAESVWDLGDVFINGMKGGLSPEDAYAAQIAHNDRNKKPIPPKIGEVKQKFEPEAEFYDEKYLNYLNSPEGSKLLKDPKVLAKAMKSLSQLKI